MRAKSYICRSYRRKTGRGAFLTTLPTPPTPILNRLSLHYIGANSYLFVNGVETYKFKVKDSEINTTPLCLGNISTRISSDNMKNAALYRYVCDFVVDYDNICVNVILDIDKYLMKNTI